MARGPSFHCTPAALLSCNKKCPRSPPPPSGQGTEGTTERENAMPVPDLSIPVGRDGCSWRVTRLDMGGARLVVDAGTAVVVLDHEDLQGLIEELVDLVEVAKIVRDTPPAGRTVTEPERIAREIGA